MSNTMSARFDAVVRESMALATEAEVRGNGAAEGFPMAEALVWWDLAKGLRDAAVSSARMAGYGWAQLEDNQRCLAIDARAFERVEGSA